MPLPQPQLPHRGSRVCQLPLLPLRVHSHQQYLHFNDQQFLPHFQRQHLPDMQAGFLLEKWSVQPLPAQLHQLHSHLHTMPAEFSTNQRQLP